MSLVVSVHVNALNLDRVVVIVVVITHDVVVHFLL